VKVETKEQSKQWMHRHLPNKPEKFKQMSARNLMVTVFCNRKGADSGIHATRNRSTLGGSEQKAWNVDIRHSAPPWQ
jgi:hypothetical protein